MDFESWLDMMLPTMKRDDPLRFKFDKPVDKPTLISATFIYDDGRQVDAAIHETNKGYGIHVPIPAADTTKGRLSVIWNHYSASDIEWEFSMENDNA